MAKIHPTAVVEDGAILADGVEVGPMCYVGPEVKIGEGTRLIGQCHVSGSTTIGKENVIYPFASLGCNAQDISPPPAKTTLVIGDKNVFREGCTVHTGAHDKCETRVGNNNFIMNCAHIAHDCIIHDHVILVGYAGVTGHCEVFDHVICSAYSGIHQFCRIGRFAMLSGGSVFSQDIAPFVIAEGRNGPVRGINVVGLKRNGFSAETIKVLRDLYKIFFRSGLNSSNAIAKIKEELPMLPEVQEFLDFFNSSKRGVHQGRTPGKRA
jgi:UDP-N-acetylglucosamine acyltransferase